MNKWLKILLVILSFAIISIVLFFILKAFNITNLSTLKSIIAKSGKYGPIVYTIILVFVLVIFCFIPLLNTSLIIIGIALLGSKTAFVCNIIAICFSTIILFFIGDKCGENFAKKLIGEKGLNDAQNLIDKKSKFWLPIFFIIPAIPDEAICLVAGMTKMKLWYLLLVSILYHAIEIGLLCFIGSGIISWSTLSLIDWFVLINVILLDFMLLLKFEKYIERKTKND